MALKNTTQRWGWLAQALHWTMALVIIEQLITGRIMAWLGAGQAQDDLFYASHEPFGVLVLLLLVIRFSWRMMNTTPSLPSAMPLWQVKASHVSHWGLYLAIAVMVSSAWVMSSYANFPVSPNAPWTLPNFSDYNRDIARRAYNVHVWTGWTIVALVSVHAAAAIKHHVIDKDTVLRRMLPERFFKEPQP